MVKVVVEENLKRPLSAYFLWLNANRETITKAAGTSSAADVTKKAAEMWKAISDAEKKPYEEQNKQLKDKYEAYLKTPEGEAAMKSLKEEKRAAKQEDVGKAQKTAAKMVVKDENLKKPQSAYWLWMNANREKVTKEAGSASASVVGKKAGEMWKAMTDEEKKPFEEEAKQQKEKYDMFMKTPEGEAAMKAFKDAQTAAMSEVKGAAKLDQEKPEKKRMRGAGDDQEGSEEASPAPKAAKTSKQLKVPAAKKAHAKKTVEPVSMISAEVLEQALKMGNADSGVSYKSLLEKVVSTEGLADVDQEKALKMLEKHGGLLNKVRPELLGA